MFEQFSPTLATEQLNSDFHHLELSVRIHRLARCNASYPAILVTWEADVGGWLEVRSLRPVWATW